MNRYGTISPFDGTVENGRICLELAGEMIWLEPYGDNAIRFRSSASLHIDPDLNWTLLPPLCSHGSAHIDGGVACLENGKLRAELSSDGTVIYYNEHNQVLLEEQWLDKRSGTAPQRGARTYAHISSWSFETDVYFQSDPQEHFFGLGQEANDCLDLKGCTVDLFQKNTKCTIPYVVSTKGYGFLWNNPSIGRVELTENHTHWHSDACSQIDYIVIAGDAPEEINRTFTAITGRADPLPEWAAGFWQSRLRYETQDQVLAVAREYQRLGVPLDVLVIDYFHWPRQGDWKFDEAYWPDVPAMCRELEQMGIHPMVSIWPTVDPRSENYPAMKRKNYLIRPERGVDAFFMIMGPQGIFDATNPGARRFIWDTVKRNYYDKGIRMFWLDEAEPEMRPYSFDNVRYYLGNGLEMSNVYPYYYAKAFYDGQRSLGQTEMVNLVRCAWLGSQRLGVALWSGDIPSDFDSLRCQIKAGLNVSMCGIPCKIGGEAAFQYVVKVIELAMKGDVDATVTNALSKEAINMAGHHYSGHTEIYADYTHTPKYTMMLAHNDLRVVHVSTHVSLREACDRVKKDRVLDCIRIANVGCKALGIKTPKIGVAGLNPHCGENGMFGTEEIEEIQPAIDAAMAEGICIPERMPTPPDTVFSKALGGWYDIVVAMYHDQGHIPLKVKGFVYNKDEGHWDAVAGVNVTLGLPIIRASVDHGTGFGHAGSGQANELSLVNAMDYAITLANNKQ